MIIYRKQLAILSALKLHQKHIRQNGLFYNDIDVLNFTTYLQFSIIHDHATVEQTFWFTYNSFQFSILWKCSPQVYKKKKNWKWLSKTYILSLKPYYRVLKEVVSHGDEHSKCRDFYEANYDKHQDFVIDHYWLNFILPTKFPLKLYLYSVLLFVLSFLIWYLLSLFISSKYILNYSMAG